MQSQIGVASRYDTVDTSTIVNKPLGRSWVLAVTLNHEP